MNGSFRYTRSAYQRPPVQLTHVDLELRLYDDHVDGVETLHLVPREAVSVIVLDAQDLEIGEVELKGVDGSLRRLTSMYIKASNRIEIVLPREYQIGEKIMLVISATCQPTHNILDGLYYDTTPLGVPPQMISQCQQWGFQRIMPIIDDCTAKCTWRTVLEGSARYTHLITNGDICRETNPDGVPVPVPDDPARMRITYVNTIPMPPYLFLVAAGTWDVLVDKVTTSRGRTIRLEYLVPLGRTVGAAIPMAILKDSVAWQADRLSYDYCRDCYRTICMEKSNFGGMENVGNTTIVTEAALIDEWTTDRRLIYAHGVIIHEFEHNHCGSDVTMETPFDMWLNEAFTVNVEREYIQEKFGHDLMRLNDLDSMRAPLLGPLAVEDSGKMGRIVREGFNHPDEVVDGVTYVKAPEVLGMLRTLMGAEAYEAAIAWYFSEYNGRNAGTDQFLDAFRRFSPRNLDSFFHEWLFTIGYPVLTGSYVYEADSRRLIISLAQKRGGGAGNCFTVPFHVTGVDSSGCPMPTVDRTLILDSASHEAIFEDVSEAPTFIDWNSGRAFYGTFEEAATTPDALLAAVRTSPFAIGRVEALRRLSDIEMAAAIADAAYTPSVTWLGLFPEVLSDTSLPDGIRARLLTVSEEMLNREYLPRGAERQAAARRLFRQAAKACGLEPLLAAYTRTCRTEVDEPLDRAIPRRTLCAAIGMLLAELDEEAAYAAIEAQFDAATCASDRLNAAKALNGSHSTRRFAVMERLGEACRKQVATYGAYLQVVASSPRPDVFDDVAREETCPPFRLDHPGHSRSLYGALAANNAQIWTEQGLAWAGESLVRLAPINEYVANVVLSAFQLVDQMEEPLRIRVRTMLEGVAKRISAEKYPSLYGRITQILG